VGGKYNLEWRENMKKLNQKGIDELLKRREIILKKIKKRGKPTPKMAAEFQRVRRDIQAHLGTL